jgi:hypothetical protein
LISSTNAAVLSEPNSSKDLDNNFLSADFLSDSFTNHNSLGTISLKSNLP